MKIIGITGGVGAGKSQILQYLQQNLNCRLLLADEAAHKVKEPGQPCYDRLVQLLGRQVLQPEGSIDKQKMAALIFGEKALLEAVNDIIHPAVKQYILEEIRKEKQAGRIDYFFLEAALLIEEGYRAVVDELWYIYAPVSVRQKRLMCTRGYSPEKIKQIMESQLSEEEFRAGCDRVIDNGGSLEDTYEQLDRILQELSGKEKRR